MDEKDDEIRKKAYSIWEQDGCPEGQALEHWFRAKEELSKEELASNPMISPEENAKEMLPGPNKSGGAQKHVQKKPQESA